MGKTALFLFALAAVCAGQPQFAVCQRDSSRSSRTHPKPSTGTLALNAALLDQDMQVRPVPLHGLMVSTGGSDTLTVRTGIDGKVSVPLPPGTYNVVSVSSVQFKDRRFRWKLTTSITRGETTDLSLTNDNAISEGVAVVADTSPGRDRLDPAASLFQRLRNSVFKIEAGLVHGSGFLADTLGGVIITNAHVVEGGAGDQVSVVIDSLKRVRADVLARDAEADIVILRVHPSAIAERARITLQRPVGKPPVVPGERLAAMGFPLNQGLTITSGIASSVRAGAIISDVNINHGNSGGPLVNVDGEAVAVNTFGDFSGAGGPGISGSIVIAKAGPALARAASQIEATTSPSPDPLPVLPAEQLDLASLKAFADTTNPRDYRDFTGITVGGFDLTVQTPVRTLVAIKEFENDVAKDRKKREALAGLPESERYSEVREFRDWGEYVGQQAAPVVSFAIVPRVGETGGSLFKRLMLSPALKATYKFKGDLRAARVFRNRVLAEPIKGGHTPTKVYVDNQWVSLKDVADQGFYVFDIEILRPDDDGSPPTIAVAVQDLKSPRSLKCRELPSSVIARAWNDFEDFYRNKRSSVQFVRSDAKRVKDRKPLGETGFLKDECDWYREW